MAFEVNSDIFALFGSAVWIMEVSPEREINDRKLVFTICDKLPILMLPPKKLDGM